MKIEISDELLSELSKKTKSETVFVRETVWTINEEVIPFDRRRKYETRLVEAALRSIINQ